VIQRIDNVLAFGHEAHKYEADGCTRSAAITGALQTMPDGREMFHRRQRIKWYYTGLSKMIVNNNGKRSFLRQ